VTRRLLTAFALAVVCAVSVTSTQGAPDPQVTAPATLRSVMRALLFVNANVFFFAQDKDPAAVPQDVQASAAVNPLAGTFGKWEAVDNAALALVEVAALLEIPRSCSNGKPAPVGDAEWRKRLDVLRDAGRAAYKASQSRDQDVILEVSEQVALACTGCHRVYASQDMTRRCASQ
jgi:hypothetical protein